MKDIAYRGLSASARTQLGAYFFADKGQALASKKIRRPKPSCVLPLAVSDAQCAIGARALCIVYRLDIELVSFF